MSIAEKLATIAENQQRVYEAGKAAGGGDAYYDTFWDNTQNYGNRESHSYAFAGAGWNDNNFKPKYNMHVTNGQYMFRYTAIEHLAEILSSQGVVIDFSAITNTDRMFADGALVHIGECDFTNTTKIASTFANEKALQTIDKITVNESNVFDTSFVNCIALANVAFDGVIGTSINFQWSPLSVESMKNIIEHLKLFTTPECTLTFSESCWAALDADENNVNEPWWDAFESWRTYVEQEFCWLT